MDMTAGFPSFFIMVVIDVAMFAIAVSGTVLLVKAWPILNQVKALHGVVFLLIGIWIQVGLYVFDFVTMTILPFTIGMEPAMVMMRDAHLNYSWYINLSSTLFIFLGIIQIIRGMNRQIIENKVLRIKAEESNRAKTRFISSMSHELRTPLNSIIGFSQIIKSSSQSEKDIEYANFIEKSGGHLQDLINDILDLSRIESGFSELRLEPTDLARTIGDVVDIMKTRLEAAAVRIDSDAVASVGQVWVDEKAIRQILIGLLDNAIRHSDAGGTIAIALERAPDDEEIRLSVVDDGEGVAEEALPHIFEPFFTTNPRVTQRGRRFGLGLAIYKRLVEGHGGRVAVSSQPGEGTAIRLTLPTRVDEREETAARRGSTPQVIRLVEGG